MIKPLKEYIYYNSQECFHTSDAYFKNLYYDNNVLIIPYLNLGIANHELNPEERVMYLNYCYVLCKGITYFQYWKIKGENYKSASIGNINLKGSEVYLGGSNLQESEFLPDYKIICTEILLYTTNVSKLSELIWVPLNNIIVPHNYLHHSEVQDFFNSSFLPTELNKYLKFLR